MPWGCESQSFYLIREHSKCAAILLNTDRGHRGARRTQTTTASSAVVIRVVGVDVGRPIADDVHVGVHARRDLVGPVVGSPCGEQSLLSGIPCLLDAPFQAVQVGPEFLNCAVRFRVDGR